LLLEGHLLVLKSVDEVSITGEQTTDFEFIFELAARRLSVGILRWVLGSINVDVVVVAVVTSVTSMASESVAADLKVISELAARRLGIGILRWVLGSLHVVVVVVAVVASVASVSSVSMASESVAADLKVSELAARGLGSIGILRWVLRSRNLHVGVVVVTSEATFVVVVEAAFVVVAMMTHVASKSTTFPHGKSDSGCDSSSSKNECNGKFDLNHFE